MDTWDNQIPFRDALLAQGKSRNMAIDELALDRAFDAGRYVGRLGGVFDRVSRLT
jgi:adenylosuccinate lyase